MVVVMPIVKTDLKYFEPSICESSVKFCFRFAAKLKTLKELKQSRLFSGEFLVIFDRFASSLFEYYTKIGDFNKNSYHFKFHF